VTALRPFAHALEAAALMGWQILWALVFGFLLSGVIETAVRRATVTRLVGDDSPRSLLAASALGAASSSCSYAAVAMARSLFRKGADFTAAMAFEIASTNLVIELGVVLALLIGWQFTLAEFIGGPLIIVLVTVSFRVFLRARIVDGARLQAEKGVAGRMEGHAGMDMTIKTNGTLGQRIVSAEGRSVIARAYAMNWASVWTDILLGVVVAGALNAWVPPSFWSRLFFAGHPVVSKLWGPLIGPVVAIGSFVCSVGNVPLAAVLWKGGISFGGVVAFIFADLIILPILLIYRKYYGGRMTLVILASFYAAMSITGYAVELVFGTIGLVPSHRRSPVIGPSISWNYTTVLNLIAIAITVALLVKVTRDGAWKMVTKMDSEPAEHAT
jgi:hypothetical protein